MTVCSKHCEPDSSQALIASLKNWIGCYFHKHYNHANKVKNFETDFVQRLKMFLISESKDLFWTIFYSKRLEYKLSDQTHGYPENREICFELDFECFSDLKYKPRILVFQRKTKPVYSLG
jgi:hypothetical protein